jgi:hypothetical protein
MPCPNAMFGTAAFPSVPSRRRNQDACFLARSRLWPDRDLHIAIERRQKKHQPLDRESFEPIVRKRGNLRPVDFQAPRCGRFSPRLPRGSRASSVSLGGSVQISLTTQPRSSSRPRSLSTFCRLHFNLLATGRVAVARAGIPFPALADGARSRQTPPAGSRAHSAYTPLYQADRDKPEAREESYRDAKFVSAPSTPLPPRQPSESAASTPLQLPLRRLPSPGMLIAKSSRFFFLSSGILPALLFWVSPLVAQCPAGGP